MITWDEYCAARDEADMAWEWKYFRSKYRIYASEVGGETLIEIGFDPDHACESADCGNRYCGTCNLVPEAPEMLEVPLEPTHTYDGYLIGGYLDDLYF